MVEVVIVGSIALDSIETPFGKVEETMGGSAAYAGIASSFFAKTGIIGVIGKDYPKEYLDLLEKRGIDLTGLQVEEGKSFRWKGKYEFDLNKAITLKTELNVFEKFNPKINFDYRRAKYVFLANINPSLQLNVMKQVLEPEVVVCDTMNYWIENEREKVLDVIRRSKIALMNDAEARMLFKTTNIVKAAKEALKLGAGHVIIKKGEHGALMFSHSGCFSAPAYPLENVVDPTGAGDTFAGALTGYLAKTRSTSERNIRKGIIYASVLSSLNAEGFGLEKMKKLNDREIRKRFKEFKKMARF